MGWRRWLLKHGPGFVGSMAKTMVLCYTQNKDACPDLSEDELLKMTLRSRARAHAMLGSSAFDESSIEKIIKEAKTKDNMVERFFLKKLSPLAKVILYAWNVETPGSEEVFKRVCQIAQDFTWLTWKEMYEQSTNHGKDSQTLHAELEAYAEMIDIIEEVSHQYVE